MILAPMQGLTELLFRRVYEECFPGAIRLAVTPFLSLTHNLHNLLEESGQSSTLRHYLRDVLHETNKDSIPITPQILGKEPEEFIALANRLYDMGYSEVNWNIGCPMRNITGKHRGSGILPYPEEVRAVLNAMIPRLKPTLSVKMRIGLRQKEEIFALVPILNDYPIASVTIHPRLGRQQYTGVPDLDTFGKVLPLIKHPVIYNGDIRTASDIKQIHERFPSVADIMVGRGILFNPTLPLGKTDQDLAKHFICRLLEEIRRTAPTEEGAIRKTKEYWCLLWRSLQITESEARKVLREQELKVVEKMIYTFIQ